MTPDSLSDCCEEKIRANPFPAVGIALAAGVVLSRLPVPGIVAAAVRAGLALVRPTLLVLGVAKAAELARARGRSGATGD